MLDKDDGDISPVFVQFLDAVAQLVRMFPHAFEFNGRLPLLLAHHLYSCRFGTFLCNSERERAEAGLIGRTPSLWAYVLGGGAVTASLRSSAYTPSAGDVLLPYYSTVLRNVTLWSEWFLRFSPYPSLPSMCTSMETYPDSMYNRKDVEAALGVGRGVQSLVVDATSGQGEKCSNSEEDSGGSGSPKCASSQKIEDAGGGAGSQPSSAPVTQCVDRDGEKGRLEESKEWSPVDSSPSIHSSASLFIPKEEEQGAGGETPLTEDVNVVGSDD